MAKRRLQNLIQIYCSIHEKFTEGSLENEYVNCFVRLGGAVVMLRRSVRISYTIASTVLSFSSKLHIWGISALKIYSDHYSVSSYNLVRLTF